MISILMCALPFLSIFTTFPINSILSIFPEPQKFLASLKIYDLSIIKHHGISENPLKTHFLMQFFHAIESLIYKEKEKSLNFNIFI
jgi:hypothetical protein